MNEYMSRRDYDGAERHLLYWLEEAKLGQDERGQLMLRNELVGHYRKVGNREKAMENAEEALRLIDVLEFDGTISSGTTYVNSATACNAFGDNERSLRLFEKAKAVYESAPGVQPALMGGLYNNMALTCAALGKYKEAMALYQQASEAMSRVESGELEQAITCLNMADTLEKMSGMEQNENRIYELLDQAYDLLKESHGADEGYYAFVLEKCAPTFAYFGYFMAAEELEQKAAEIYARA
jgi:tetratricopeptide (TPR) repeat protein